MKDLERTFATTHGKSQEQFPSIYCEKHSSENLTINSLQFAYILNEFVAEVKMNLNNYFKLNISLKRTNTLN